MIDLKYATHSREPFFEIAKKHIQPNSVVLDIGAGDGSFSRYCERNDFFLFDGNEKTVQWLKEEKLNATFGTLPKLPYQDNFFDLIHCSHVVEHLRPQELYDSLKEMDRCLKNEGFLVISTPLYWDGFFDDLSHQKPYNPFVFIKYLCNKSKGNYSRDHVSSNYEVKKVQYRYRLKDFSETILTTKNGKLAKFSFRILNSISFRIGIKKIEKTGYTLVLKKN
jgi:SAM-dependent methyltransferase